MAGRSRDVLATQTGSKQVAVFVFVGVLSHWQTLSHARATDRPRRKRLT